MNDMSKTQFNFCENLNVNLCNKVQDTGIFLGIVPYKMQVIFQSDNFKSTFGYDIIYQPLDLLFTQKSITVITNFFEKLKNSEITNRVLTTLEIFHNNVIHEKSCIIYLVNSNIIIEFELSFENTSEIDHDYYDEVHTYISETDDNLDDICKFICSYIIDITNFDRVYFCEFQEDDHGFVKTCINNTNLESLLHHHFPASDLPMIVREIYKINRFRFIYNTEYSSANILGTNQNLNLLNSFYRVIGESHLQYLRNMNVKSSASFSLVINDKIHAIFGCHSTKIKKIDINILAKIQILVEIFAMRIKKENEILIRNKETVIAKFIKIYKAYKGNLNKIPNEYFESIKKVFDANLITFRHNNIWKKDCELPDNFKNSIIEYLKKIKEKNRVIFNESICSLNKNLETYGKNLASGVFCLIIEKNLSNVILLFRPEMIRQIKWSGNPNNFELQTNGSLVPRNSFKTWYESVILKSKPWNEIDQKLALLLSEGIISKIYHSDKIFMNNISKNFYNFFTNFTNKFNYINKKFDSLINIQPELKHNFFYFEHKDKIPCLKLLRRKNHHYDCFIFKKIITELVQEVNEINPIPLNFEVNISEKYYINTNNLIIIISIIYEFIYISLRSSLTIKNKNTINLNLIEKNEFINILLQSNNVLPDSSKFYNNFKMITFLTKQMNGYLKYQEQDFFSLDLSFKRKYQPVRNSFKHTLLL